MHITQYIIPSVQMGTESFSDSGKWVYWMNGNHCSQEYMNINLEENGTKEKKGVKEEQ